MPWVFCCGRATAGTASSRSSATAKSSSRWSRVRRARSSRRTCRTGTRLGALCAGGARRALAAAPRASRVTDGSAVHEHPCNGVLVWPRAQCHAAWRAACLQRTCCLPGAARTCIAACRTCRLKYLAERCWAELPEVRPSLTQLYNELENLQAQLCPGGQDASRLVVQGCIKPKRPPSNVPPVQLAGQKAAQQMSRLAQVGLAVRRDVATGLGQGLGGLGPPCALPSMCNPMYCMRSGCCVCGPLHAHLGPRPMLGGARTWDSRTARPHLALS